MHCGNRSKRKLRRHTFLRRFVATDGGSGAGETNRHWYRRAFDTVRDAFAAAKPIGAGYVDAVRHAYNPFVLQPGPFLSRYSGQLDI
ncbi:MAG TPA: hypothetical protein VE890_02145 [Thermoguttaceae bacterium]|nr:hypothetical protein [Thermoguttaceae bacterium]